MGLLKKLTIRSKRKSMYNLADDEDGTIRPPKGEHNPTREARRMPRKSNFNIESAIVEEEEAADDPDPAFILIGIDFGTTYSGVAWAYSKQPDDIKIITNWDSTEWLNSDKGKAPTKIAYDESCADGSLQKDPAWGYGIGEAEAAEWFKLLLLDEGDMDDQQRESPQIKRARFLLQKAGKSPVQAVADYLRLLWAHAIQNIEKDFGEATVEGLPFRVVLTVPAVWTQRAVNRMRQAAKDAGILWHRLAGETTLHFVSEPEAAALATFDDLKARPNFQKGDTFVVCDAGGGTVDLISYKVQQAKPMHLAECVEGSGKLCGAVFLDQDFEALMKQLVGDAWNVPDGVIKGMMNTQWENGIKRGFEGQDKTWKITLPYECVKRGAPPHIPLDKGHVKEIFDDVVSQIRSLVNAQISAIERKEGRLPKAVVLVGGFGSCRYLFNLLSLENKHRGIEVYQSTGTKPWTAICRGAVLKALTNSMLSDTVVQSRISRCNYGTRYHTDFDPTIHLEIDKKYDRIRGNDKAENQLKWYLKRGENISESRPVRLHWHLYAPASQYESTYPLKGTIHACSDPTPPPRYTESVRPSVKLESDSRIDVSRIAEFRGADGNSYKKINFDIEMSVIGTALEFALWHEGKRIGCRSLEAEVEDAW